MQHSWPHHLRVCVCVFLVVDGWWFYWWSRYETFSGIWTVGCTTPVIWGCDRRQWDHCRWLFVSGICLFRSLTVIQTVKPVCRIWRDLLADMKYYRHVIISVCSAESLSLSQRQSSMFVPELRMLLHHSWSTCLKVSLTATSQVSCTDMSPVWIWGGDVCLLKVGCNRSTSPWRHSAPEQVTDLNSGQ